MSNEPAENEIPHERRSKLSNMVTGKAKEALGRLTHDDALVQEGRTEEEVAAHNVRPDLDGLDDPPEPGGRPGQ